MEETLEGYIEKIVFRNEENGYTVFSLSEDDFEITCVGSFTLISEGEFVKLTGNYTSHPVYGEQFKVSTYEVKEPEDMVAMEKYLASGAIKGIGPAMAARITKKFKGDTFRIIEEEPERLVEIKGISERIARKIAEQFEEKRDMRNAMIYLQKFNISTNLAVKIYQKYGAKMYQIMEENPYRLAEDISGIGFKLADEIAEKAGIGLDSDFRIKAGIIYVLSDIGMSGNIYIPREELLRRTGELLRVDSDILEKHMDDMMTDNRIVCKVIDDIPVVYSSNSYYIELNCARMLLDMNVKYDADIVAIEKRVSALERQAQIILDEMQRTAVLEAARNGVFVITGGPGTGKTTTINTIIKYFETEGLDILLAAPTGRAAKRMSETTGCEAQTIHRLLELKTAPEDHVGNVMFERNEENPLETDVVIIDEMSMVDIHLLYALLRALVPGTRLILVGDVNQLPSVGPGNVLKDIIQSHCFSVIKLSKIFRQAAESDIITNAHRINAGEAIELDNKSKDFFLLKRYDVNRIISVVIQLMKEKLPKYVDAEIHDIQVMTPMRKGELGVERLNRILQEYINPPSPEKKEKETVHGIFREGDKVMQIKNNYQLEWELKSRFGTVTETGTGVFNGDIGKIQTINQFAETVTVIFEEGRQVEYRFADLEELELAYAITVHKSQGSEYPAVIMPLLSGTRFLFNRNLLYTAVTRAKKCVTIVGNPEVVQYMIQNESEQRRYSSLALRIQEMSSL